MMTKGLERMLFEHGNFDRLDNSFVYRGFDRLDDRLDDSFVYRDEFTVDMNDGKYIEDNGRLKTYGLSGCYATLIYTRNGDKKQGILTHYPPTAISMNISKLRQLVEEHPEMKDADLKRAVILHEDDSFSPKSIKQYNSQVLSMLECGIKVALGNDIEIEKRKYHGPQTAGEGHREVYLLLKSKSWASFIGGGKFE